MNNSINFIKSKTVSKNLNRLKNYLEANPGMILNVIPEKMIVITKHDQGLEVMYFDEETYWKAEDMMKQEIKTRPNPDDRIEYWECNNDHGVFDLDIHDALLESRKEFLPRNKKVVNERALAELCEAHGVNPSLGSLFLNELKLSTNPADQIAINRAQILGLM